MNKIVRKTFATAALISLSTFANAGIELHIISGGDYSGFSAGWQVPPEVANDGTVLLHQNQPHKDNWHTWTKSDGLNPFAGGSISTLGGNHMSNDSDYLVFQSGSSHYDYYTPNGVLEKGRVGYSNQVIQRISGDGKTLVGRPHSATISFYEENTAFSVRLPLENSPIPQNLGVNTAGNRLLVSQSTKTYFADVPEGGNFRDATLLEIPVDFYVRVALSDDGLSALGTVRDLTPGCDVSNVIYHEQLGLQEINCHDAFAPIGVSGDGKKVIGYSQAEGTSYIWDKLSGSRDLRNILLQNGYDLSSWTNFRATDISEDGSKIVGWGIDGTGESHAFMMEVVPECTVAF